MKVRFQADADLKLAVASGVRRRNLAVDFQTAVEARLPGLPDPEVLALAAREGRVLVSHDRQTMPTHFAKFVSAATSPGVIIVPQSLPVREVIDDLLLIWEASEAAEWVNHLTYLPL
jgi:hypothetical protein